VRMTGVVTKAQDGHLTFEEFRRPGVCEMAYLRPPGARLYGQLFLFTFS